MKTKALQIVIYTVALMFTFSTSPVNALASPPVPFQLTERRIVDYCGMKISGQIRAITVSKCDITELSLGNQALTKADTRPTKLVDQLNSRFLVARAAAQKLGYDLNITSGYRSLGRQEYLFMQAVKKHGSKAEAIKWVLPAEKSNHPWGLAIDINYGISGPKARQSAFWLEKNGYKYGLCRRYVNEWWHFEPQVSPGTKCPAMEPYAS